MATIRLPPDFKEFLKLLNSEGVQYLVVGGYAVAFYGHPRATGDLDVWVGVTAENAQRIVRALEQFGFAAGSVPAETFKSAGKVIRMGHPPMRIELLTGVSGIDFPAAFSRRHDVTIDGVSIPMINRVDLVHNKRAAGRPRDLDDLTHLD